MSETDQHNSHAHNSLSSSFTHSSHAFSNFELYRSDSKRLEKVYGKLSHHLIGLRQRKIELLERLDATITLKSRYAAQIQALEAIQTKQMRAKRCEREKLLIEELKNRELAQQRLADSIQHFKNQHRQAVIQVQYNRATRLLELIKTNLQLQASLQSLLQKQSSKKQKQQSIMKEIHQLVQQKNQLESQAFHLQQPKQPKKQYYDLLASQLHAQSQRLGLTEQILAKQVFEGHEFDDYSTNDLLRLKNEEQLQRELLFEEIKKLKSEMNSMQIQNGLMQQMLGN